MNTISEAKQYLRNNFESGVNCPCCDQFVKQNMFFGNEVGCEMYFTLSALDRVGLNRYICTSSLIES